MREIFEIIDIEKVGENEYRVGGRALENFKMDDDIFIFPIEKIKIKKILLFRHELGYADAGVTYNIYFETTYPISSDVKSFYAI